MKPSADNSRPGVPLSELAPPVEETGALAHGLTPPDPRTELTQSFHGTTPAEQSTVAPELIGRYRILRLLGQGTFGRVWLAMDDELQRQVAIKVVFPTRLADPANAEAWLAEARALAALDHPLIVPVYDVGRAEDNSVYAVAKFIPGRTLQEQIKILPDGRIVISTVGPSSAVEVAAADEDLLVLEPSSLGETTAGILTQLFDGKDVGLGDVGEDVDAVAIGADGQIYLSTRGAFSVPGLAGDSEDVFVFSPTSLGPTTEGSYCSALFFDGSAFGLEATNVSDIDLL